MLVLIAKNSSPIPQFRNKKRCLLSEVCLSDLLIDIASQTVCLDSLVKSSGLGIPKK